jgi:hypothetical protein
MKIDSYNVEFIDENGIKMPPSKYKNYTDRINSENNGVILNVKKDTTEILMSMYPNCVIEREE